MKYIAGIVWLVLALAVRNSPVPRRFFAYVAPVVVLAHAGALGLGLLYQRMFDRGTVEGGVSLAGFLIGIVAGGVAGALLGGVVQRSHPAYLVAQLAAAGFLAFLPLFRF